MKPRSLRWTCAVLCLLAVSACDSPSRRRPASAKLANVILISVDTLGARELRPFRSEAPGLSRFDRFAERAARLERAYSTAGWTLPAHASLLTGLYPVHHGATDPRLQLVAPKTAALAARLQAAGFATAAFTDGGYVHHRYGLAAGFDRYDDWPEVPFWREDPFAEWLPRSGRPNSPYREKLFDRGIAFLESPVARRGPFFLFLHTYAVHDYFKLDPRTGEVAPRNRGFDRHYLRCLQGETTCRPEDWTRLQQRYREEIVNFDLAFGRLLDSLDRTGLGETTFVVFLSDHGESFDVDHGRMHHGGRLHEDQLHVPLLIAGPGIEPRSTAVPVSLVDTYPTILDLLGLPETVGLDGQSFASALRGEAMTQPRVLFAAEHYYVWEEGRRRPAKLPLPDPLALAVVRDPWWYIRTGVREELYDIRTDAAQQDNLAAGESSILALHELAQEHTSPAKPQELRPANDDIDDQLRSLGYLQ